MSNKFQQKEKSQLPLVWWSFAAFLAVNVRTWISAPWIPLFSTSEPPHHLVVRTKGSWVTSQMRRSQGAASIEIVFLIRMMVWPLVAFLVWLFCCRKHKPNLPLPPPLSWKQNRTKSNRQSYPKKKERRGELETSGILHSEFLTNRKGSSFTSFLKMGCPPPVRIQLHKGVTA